MKPITYLVAALATGAAAVDVQKQIIISYPDMSTPDWVLNEAKNAILEAGGAIIHEYNLIKGFSATVAEKAVEKIKSLESQTQYKAVVEEDQIVTVNT